MRSAGADTQRHVVVFDCNVYLDVASVVGPPFTWEKFDAATARLTRPPAQMPMDRCYPDSVRALAVCRTGNLSSLREPLEVCINDSIQILVHKKAMQELGWQRRAADTLLTELVAGLLDMSNGQVVDNIYPDGNPPLDHEDGMVFGACRILAGDDPLAQVYCVTRDKGFIEAYRDGALSRHTRVLTPATFVSLVRAARNPALRMNRPGQRAADMPAD